jgi:hypothetical protein
MSYQTIRELLQNQIAQIYRIGNKDSIAVDLSYRFDQPFCGYHCHILESQKEFYHQKAGHSQIQAGL